MTNHLKWVKILFNPRQKRHLQILNPLLGAGFHGTWVFDVATVIESLNLRLAIGVFWSCLGGSKKEKAFKICILKAFASF
jgi:hypothetical protein